MKINKHIQNAIKSTLFFVFLIPAFFQISYFARKDISHTTRIRAGFYALKRNSLDVCIIGTSGTFSAYCPMEAWKKYGFTSYNFCVNCMGSETFTYAIKEVLKTQKPKVIVIDVYPFVIHQRVGNMKSEYQVRYNTDGYRYSLNRIRLIHNVVPKTFNKIPFYFDIIKYGGGKFDFSLRNFACNNIKRGYSNLPWEEGHPAIATDNVKPLESDFDNDLETLIKYCKKVNSEGNIKFLFLYYPYGNAREDSIEYLNYIKHKVKENSFDFMDCEEFLEEFNFDYMQDFWGDAHWNIFGAEKITDVMAKHFIQMYNFSDKKGLEKYQFWDNDIDEWDEYVINEKEYINRDKREKTQKSNNIEN